MSWQAYVDNNLIGSGQITQAGIYGLQGGQWAASSGFSVTPAELQTIQQGFGDAAVLQANGVRVNGIKYMFLRSDDRSIYGKKGNDGVVIVKTTQAILIGVYDDKVTPGNATKVVEGLADYLISVNYQYSGLIFTCIGQVLIMGAGYGTRLQRDLVADKSGKYPKNGIPPSSVHVITNAACYDAFVSWAKRNNVPEPNIASDGTTSNETRLGAVPDILEGVKRFGLQSDNVLVIGGDTLFLHDFDLATFLADFHKTSACLVTAYKVPDEVVHKVGIMEINNEGTVTGFVEKPQPTETTSRFACPCFYLFHQQSLHLLQDFLNECQSRNAGLQEYDATGKFLAYLWPRFPVQTLLISGRIDVGGLASYIEAIEYFEQQ
ncbi:unnamed protein product [Umbelopsis vinacea]